MEPTQISTYSILSSSTASSARKKYVNCYFLSSHSHPQLICLLKFRPGASSVTPAQCGSQQCLLKSEIAQFIKRQNKLKGSDKILYTVRMFKLDFDTKLMCKYMVSAFQVRAFKRRS